MIWDVVGEIKNHKDKNHRENTDDLSGNRIFMSVIIPTNSDETADRTDNPKNDSHWFNGHKHCSRQTGECSADAHQVPLWRLFIF